MSKLFASGYVPVYSTARAEVAGIVMLLHATEGHVALFDTSGRLIRKLPFGDTASPRLHPSGHIYYVAGAELRREHIRGGGSERVQLFESRVTVGGNHGDFDPSFRYLPILRNEHVGIYDVETGGYVEAHAGPGVDWVQIGSSDVIAVGFKEPERIISFSGDRLERSRQLAPALGHEDVAIVDGHPVLVTTTSNWRSDWPVGNGGEEWLVAIHMESGEITPIRQTGWRAYHIACSGDRVCVSFYSAGIPPLFPRGEIWVGRVGGGGEVVAVAEGASPSPYTAQPHAAWSADGRRVYYGEHNNTKAVDVQRDNSDQIPIDNVQLDQAGQAWPLVLSWTRKDKLREVVNQGDRVKVFFEGVRWPDREDGAFAALWVFTRQGDGWLGRFAWHMRRVDVRFEREVLVNNFPVAEYSISVPIEALGVKPGEEYAMCFAAPTTRTAIVRYEMADSDEPTPPGIGAPWPCFEDGRAPVLAMTPTGEMPHEMWGHWLDNIHPALIEMGVDGFHCPMQGRWRPHYYRLLVERNAQHGLITAWWLVAENGELSGPELASEQLRRLIALYDDMHAPGWQIVGPTYDVFQAEGFGE